MDGAQTIKVGDLLHRTLLSTVLTDEDIKKAGKELNEFPEKREKCLRVLKEMILEEKDLTVRSDDIYLLRFLRSRKFNCDLALDLIRIHFRFRARYPKVFPAPSSIEQAMRAGIFNYLPHRDHLGRAIFVVKMGRWDPSIISYKEFVAVGNILSEWVLDNPVTQINGYIGIWDFKGFSFSHSLPFCLPSHVWLLTNLMQNCFPARFKIAYCVNCTPLAYAAWRLFRPILKEKFQTRIMIFGSNMTDMHQYVNAAILPKEYGGQQPFSDCTDAVNKILEKETYFNYSRTFGYNSKQSNF